jgi:hypothetical protein
MIVFEARVLERVEMQSGDLRLHRRDVVGDLAQLAMDRGVHRREHALERLRRDLGERHHVGERDVGARFLLQIGGDPVVMLLDGDSHRRLPVRT